MRAPSKTDVADHARKIINDVLYAPDTYTLHTLFPVFRAAFEAQQSGLTSEWAIEAGGLDGEPGIAGDRFIVFRTDPARRPTSDAFVRLRFVIEGRTLHVRVLPTPGGPSDPPELERRSYSLVD